MELAKESVNQRRLKWKSRRVLARLLLLFRQEQAPALHNNKLIEGRIKRVEVFGVQAVLGQSQSFTKPLEVHNFAGAQEFNGVFYVGVVGKAENIVVSGAGFLFCCELIRRTRCEKPLKTLGFSLAQGF